MNRPKRPTFSPPRKKKPTVARPADGGGPPRRRSPLDYVPQNVEPRFQVLGTGADRQALVTYATPAEMMVIHGFTREIETSYQKFNGRVEEFWTRNPQALELARKVDQVLAGVVARKGKA
jgi:hypothetical protein